MADAFALRIMDLMAESQEIPREEITLEATFEDLGMDSLDGLGLLGDLEDEFDVHIPDTEALGIETVRDVVERLRSYVPEERR